MLPVTSRVVCKWWVNHTHVDVSLGLLYTVYRASTVLSAQLQTHYVSVNVSLPRSHSTCLPYTKSDVSTKWRTQQLYELLYSLMDMTDDTETYLLWDIHTLRNPVEMFQCKLFIKFRHDSDCFSVFLYFHTRRFVCQKIMSDRRQGPLRASTCFLEARWASEVRMACSDNIQRL